MSRVLDENDMYAVLRFALIAQFAKDDWLEAYNLDSTNFQSTYNFLKKLYMTFVKVREDAQKN